MWNTVRNMRRQEHVEDQNISKKRENTVVASSNHRTSCFRVMLFTKRATVGEVRLKIL
jgi:hypothetical protein